MHHYKQAAAGGVSAVARAHAAPSIRFGWSRMALARTSTPMSIRRMLARRTLGSVLIGTAFLMLVALAVFLCRPDLGSCGPCDAQAPRSTNLNGGAFKLHSLRLYRVLRWDTYLRLWLRVG